MAILGSRFTKRLDIDLTHGWRAWWPWRDQSKGCYPMGSQLELGIGFPNHLIVAESLCFFSHFSSFPNGKSSRNREFVPGIFCVIRHNCWFCGGRWRGRWRGVSTRINEPFWGLLHVISVEGPIFFARFSGREHARSRHRRKAGSFGCLVGHLLFSNGHRHGLLRWWYE